MARKKTLRLASETVRVLGEEIGEAAGGAITVPCPLSLNPLQCHTRVCPSQLIVPCFTLGNLC